MSSFPFNNAHDHNECKSQTVHTISNQYTATISQTGSVSHSKRSKQWEKKDSNGVTSSCLLLEPFLSFGDPITDILTLVKFYHADHKKWFPVGLVFIILLCSLYFLVHSGDTKTRPAISNGFSHKRSVLVFIHFFQPW